MRAVVGTLNQGFAKELLDVADNLRRAVDAVPEAAADIDAATALAQLKTLKEGVTMTEAQLMQVCIGTGKMVCISDPTPCSSTQVISLTDNLKI